MAFTARGADDLKQLNSVLLLSVQRLVDPLSVQNSSDLKRTAKSIPCVDSLITWITLCIHLPELNQQEEEEEEPQLFPST